MFLLREIRQITNLPNPVDKILIVIHGRDVVIVRFKLHVGVYVTKIGQQYNGFKLRLLYYYVTDHHQCHEGRVEWSRT